MPPRPGNQPCVYQAPIVFMWVFYLLLTAWTAVCVISLGFRNLKGGWPLGQLLMIAFVLAYTWYFSLGIFYRVEIANDGSVLFFSFRRKIAVHVREIPVVEGPRLALIPYGFIRFRLEREKAYLFCRITDSALRPVFKRMRDINGAVTFKGL